MVRNSPASARRVEKTKSRRLGLGPYEPPHPESFSRKKFRIAFIRMVDDTEHGVAYSLYWQAYFPFLLLAWSKFPQAIPPSVSALLDDKDFLAELERVIKDFSASPYNDERESFHPAFIELLLPAFKRDRQLFVNYPRAVLMRELLRPLREFSKEMLPEFRNWATLQQISNSEGLCEAISEWSRQWNLDADWCRDLAVAALRVWLTDESLQWMLQLDFWRLSFKEAIGEMELDNIWTAHTFTDLSMIEDGAKLLSLLSQRFKFSWKGVDFQTDRWNPTTIHRDNWERDCEVKFKLYLAQRKQAGDAVPPGTVRKFRAARDEYLRKIEQSAKQAGLVKTPRRWADEHLIWAVHFQVQKWPLSKLEKTYSKSRKTVSDGVNRVLKFIDLPRRPDLPSGMPKGTRLRSRRRIVRK